jgi:tRNA (guanine9-N1)-methyltransferase
MTNQLYYVHSLNRMSTKPFRHCLFTGVTGRMKERLENKLHGEYKKFTRMEWRSEDVKDIRDAPSRSDSEWEDFKKSKKLARGASTISTDGPHLLDPPLRNPFEGQEYVYLSADAEYELESLSENETYIIGGIVDRNRYKASTRYSSST